MPAIFPKQVKRREIYQRFNLKELLGYEPSDAQKETFADLAIEKMIVRTASGNDVDGRNFASYSRKYAEKKGVGVSDVDLILTGDMLDSISDERQRNIVKIKVGEGFSTDKAHGHITGRATGKVRDFFGFNSEDDLADVISEVDSLRQEEVTIEDDTIDLAALRRAILSIGLEQVNE